MRIPFSTRISLHTGATVIAVAAALFAIWFFGVQHLGIEGARHRKIDEAIQQLGTLADHHVRTMEADLIERRGDVLVVSESIVLIRATLQARSAGAVSTPELQRHLQRIFQRLQRAYPDRYKQLMLVNPQTDVIMASSRQDDIGQRFASPDFIHQAAEPGVSELVAQAEGHLAPGLLIFRQLQQLGADNQRVGEVLAILVAVPKVRSILVGLASSERIGPGGNLSTVLYNREGAVIAQRSDAGNPAQFARRSVDHGFEGSQIEQTESGRRIAVYRHVRFGGQDGWTLAVYQDIDDTLASLQQDSLALIAIGLLLTVFALVLTHVLTRRVTRPLRALAETADRLGNGDLSARAIFDRNLADDEIAAMASSFNGMADVIARDRRGLEEKNEALQQTLSRLHATQDHLVETSRLASLGELVAGVAHELNTPIGNARTISTTLSDRSEELLALLSAGNVRRSDVEDFLRRVEEGSGLIDKNLARAAELVQSFKQVAVDRTSSQRRVFNLRLVTEEVIATLQPKLKKTPYQIELDIPSDIQIDGYPGPFGQVVVNLIENALIHGLAGRAEGSIRVQGREAGGSVVFIVEDDGGGIPAGNLARVFDPFFTTRFGQGGSGLGLHIVYNIVTGLLGGRITAESAAGKGAQFKVVMPMTAPGHDAGHAPRVAQLLA